MFHLGSLLPYRQTLYYPIDLKGMNTLVYYEKIVLAKLCEYAPWGQYYKTFYNHLLQIFVISWSICFWEAFPAQSFVCKQGQGPSLEWST